MSTNVKSTLLFEAMEESHPEKRSLVGPITLRMSSPVANEVLLLIEMKVIEM